MTRDLGLSREPIRPPSTGVWALCRCDHRKRIGNLPRALPDFMDMLKLYRCGECGRSWRDQWLLLDSEVNGD